MFAFIDEVDPDHDMYEPARLNIESPDGANFDFRRFTDE
jgi:hypothetical protein